MWKYVFQCPTADISVGRPNDTATPLLCSCYGDDSFWGIGVQFGSLSCRCGIFVSRQLLISRSFPIHSHFVTWIVAVGERVTNKAGEGRESAYHYFYVADPLRIILQMFTLHGIRVLCNAYFHWTRTLSGGPRSTALHWFSQLVEPWWRKTI